MVLDGETSNPVPILSGVPQGIVRPQMEYVTEFWKITHIGAREIITIFMFGGLLIREGHGFENISRIIL